MDFRNAEAATICVYRVNGAESGRMDRRRVVVTGVGAVGAPGIGMDDLWKGIQRPPGPAPRLIDNWDPEPWIPRRESRRLDMFTQFALVAADEAFGQSGPLATDPHRISVILGTGIGGLQSLQQLIRRLQRG